MTFISSRIPELGDWTAWTFDCGATVPLALTTWSTLAKLAQIIKILTNNAIPQKRKYDPYVLLKLVIARESIMSSKLILEEKLH